MLEIYSGKCFCDQCCGSTNSTDKDARLFTQGVLLLHSIVAQKEGLKNNRKLASLMALQEKIPPEHHHHPSPPP